MRAKGLPTVTTVIYGRLTDGVDSDAQLMLLEIRLKRTA